MKKLIPIIAVLTALVLLLVACTAADDDTGANDVAAGVQNETPVSVDNEGRAAGDRFEMTIQIEGEDEIVQAEHIVDNRNTYAIDYFYEDFDHLDGEATNSFVWKYSDAEVLLSNMSISLATESDAAALADNVRDYFESIGNFEEGTAEIAGHDAVVFTAYNDIACYTNYYLDIAQGGICIEMVCSIEGAEGIGARMNAMLDTLEFID